MAEYIEREAAIAAAFSATSLGNSAFRDVYDTVNRLRLIPTASVQPVRHGRWEEDCAGAAICSECWEFAFETSTHHLCGWFPRYCPNCGAKMDGGLERDNEKRNNG